MAELSQSICRDLAEKKIFAWISRLRPPEEIYIRTLYALHRHERGTAAYHIRRNAERDDGIVQAGEYAGV